VRLSQRYEDLRLLEGDATSNGKELKTFPTSVLPLSSGSSDFSSGALGSWTRRH